MMQRILIISQIFPSGLSGTSVKTRKTIEALLDMGFSVDVCCLHHHSMIRNSFSKKNLRLFVVNKNIISKMSIRYIIKASNILFSFMPFRIKKMFDSQLQEQINTLRKNNSYSYIFYDGFSTLQYINTVAISEERQIYIDDEDITILMKQRMITTKNLPLKTFYLLEYIRCGFYERKYLDLVDEIWAIAPNTQTRLKKVTKTKIILMPTIVPEQLNCWLKTSNDIVFTGLLSWSENVNGLRWFLEEVWKEITVKHPNTKLRVVGQMADEKLISELQSIHNVIYHGYVKNLEHVYSKSRLAIAPIFINAGIKVKILTYLSYGIPTVAFKQTTWGMKEIGGVVIANKQNYASKITELLSDSKLCQKHSDLGYKNIMNNHSKLNLMQFFKSVGIT